MASTSARRRLPIWLSAVLGFFALIWFIGTILVAFDGAQTAQAVHWMLSASELSISTLLAVTAWWGTLPRPATPTGAGPQTAAVLTGLAVAALAIVAAVIAKSHGLNLGSQVLFATAVAVAFYAVVRSRPAS
jgi:hypothetical protein